MGEEVRWAVYNEVMAARFDRAEESWPAFTARRPSAGRQLLDWDDGRPCPRWRLIEAWTVAAHGARMAPRAGSGSRSGARSRAPRRAA